MHTTHRPRFEHEIAAMREALLAGDDPHAPAHAPPPPAASPAALAYQSGFGNHFESEAVVGALPREQNSPQFVPFSLYAEQLSGAAFTTPRALNAHTWMYRLDPSVKHGRAAPRAHARLQSDFAGAAATVSPDQLRWTPLPLPGAGEVVDWVDGLVTLCGAGSAEAKDGLAIHLYACNAPMRRGAAGVDSCGGRSFCNADGDLLIVPQAGGLLLTTELGRLHVDVGEVAVVPRNIVFAIDPQGAPPAAGAHAAPAGGEGGEGEGEDGEAAARGCRGYVLETFSDRHLAPAERGPIGANGMAEARHFLYPHAWCGAAAAAPPRVPPARSSGAGGVVGGWRWSGAVRAVAGRYGSGHARRCARTWLRSLPPALGRACRPSPPPPIRTLATSPRARPSRRPRASPRASVTIPFQVRG
jgi:homogentisate 1,2-dioxygenase